MTWVRVLSGVVFVPLLLLAAWRGEFWFLFLVNAILVGACWEFYGVMEAKGVAPSKKVGVAATMILSTMCYWWGASYLGFFFAAFMIVLSLRELFRVELAFPIYDIATTVFGVVYVGWLMIHLLLLREMPRELGLDYAFGSDFLLYAILMAWSCDTMGYFCGRLWGRHKLFPRVSPKKSIEGAVAGFLASVVAAFAGRETFVQDGTGAPWLSVPETLILGCLIGVASQLGDLVESLIKRDAAMKDSSAVIPGHGGVLDRFDSLLFSAPITYYFLRWVVAR